MAAPLCLVGAYGYSVASSTGSAAVTACVSGATCINSQGCATTMYTASNGTCITGTPIAACWFHNSTSSCTQCQSGYTTAVAGCQACSSNCAVCSSTACTNCSATFTLATNGSCKAATPAGSSSSNILLSGLAFVSMIFYYIF